MKIEKFIILLNGENIYSLYKKMLKNKKEFGIYNCSYCKKFFKKLKYLRYHLNNFCKQSAIEYKFKILGESEETKESDDNEIITSNSEPFPLYLFNDDQVREEDSFSFGENWLENKDKDLINIEYNYQTYYKKPYILVKQDSIEPNINPDIYWNI